MSRRVESGFNQNQAARFRKEFRRWCDAYGATNDAVGQGLDALDERDDEADAASAKVAGTKEVANAMMTARKLTHRQARRLVVGLFLSESGRQSELRAKVLKKKDDQRARAISDAALACFERERAGLGELVGLLAKFRALRLARAPELPVFVAPEHVDKLANRLAEAAMRVVGKRNRLAVASELGKCLRESAPAMARAWCDATRQPELLRAARLGLTEAGRVTENLTKAIFREAYIYQGEVPSLSPEFDVLDRERPELTQSLDIPIFEETK
jgi:hypothetical protein